MITCDIFLYQRDLNNKNQKIYKPEGVSNIVLLWRWRYGFSHYTTGRVLKFANCAKFKIEVRDRPLARTGPHSRTILLTPVGTHKLDWKCLIYRQ